MAPPRIRRLLLMADHGRHPLWDVEEHLDVDPRTLPLTDATRWLLMTWAMHHADVVVLGEDGVPRVGPMDAAELVELGQRVCRRARQELAPQHEVLFHPEIAATVIRADLAPASPPTVEPEERLRLRRIFARVAQLEHRCAGGSYARSLVAGPDGAPAGLSWLPVGLGEVPHLDHRRVVELRGPGGEELLFVPLTELGGVLRQAAADHGASEERLRSLASLAPGAVEVAVNGLLELVLRLLILHVKRPSMA